jgi:Xaa-Pro aminopeptidase
MSTTAPAMLADALRRHGIKATPAEVDALIRGVLAAPEGHDPDAWLDLLALPEAAELRGLLRARKAELAAPQPAEPPIAERLAALRKVLDEMGADGFVQPLTDEHRSEYIPAAAQRLAWVTGFTGSAGLLVVLRERAVVFVDGRYTVQAEAELDPELFERAHLIERPPAAWLADNLRAGDCLGLDPTLHVRAEVERYRKAGAELLLLEANPVDRIWQQRPPQPVAPVDLLDERYAGEASAAKRQRMGEAVAQAGAELAVITAPDSSAWLLNLRGGDVPFTPLALAFAFLHADGAAELFIDRRKLRPGQQFGNGVAIQPIDRFEASLEALGDGRKVLLDPAWSNVRIAERLEQAGAVLVSGDEPCIMAKAQKNPVEIEGARQAQRRDGAAVCRFLRWLDGALAAGPVTEIEAAARLTSERQKDPLFRGLSFDTISATGPNAALAHYRVTEKTNRRLAPGSLYLVDSGGQYLDATTDITRTIALGPPDAEMATRFTLVLKGHIALARARFPTGTSGAQLDTLARHPLWQAGLDFDHGTGHGIGAYLCVHEGPARIAKSGTVPLKPGMILSNEPGYYKAGGYGIRIENLVVVTELGRPEGGERELLGFETITRAPIDRRLVRRDLLSAEEIAWLDAYHTLVRADLESLLDGEDRTWLARETAPLAG